MVGAVSNERECEFIIGKKEEVNPMCSAGCTTNQFMISESVSDRNEAMPLPIGMKGQGLQKSGPMVFR